MSVYGDMATDAGYPPGNSMHDEMASIAEQRHRAECEEQDAMIQDEMDWAYYEYEKSEQKRREILFRRFMKGGKDGTAS